MFDSISRRVESLLGAVTGRSLADVAVDDLLRDVRVALLEADVSLRVSKGFVESLRRKLSEAPADADARDFLAGALLSELGRLLGAPFTLPDARPLTIAVCGLQGAGKTTFAAKLAHHLADRDPLLVAADLVRPAASAQLVKMAAGIPVVVAHPGESAADVAGRGATQTDHGVIIVDTAGRQVVERELMDELRSVFAACSPDVVLLVLDAATGQESLPIAAAFSDAVDVDAVVLTKMDGDSRGGLALSVAGTLGLPTAFLSTGERAADLTRFHPDRLAKRILGDGDLLSLAEAAELRMGEQRSEPTGVFTLDDFVYYIARIRDMGPVGQLLAMVPGVPSAVRDSGLDDRHLAWVEASVLAMTAKERQDPSIIDDQRLSRIAAGAGVAPELVRGLLDQFGSIGAHFARFARR